MRYCLYVVLALTAQLQAATLEEPWLLTPGPLTTSMEVKEAMLHDYGSRDEAFLRVNQRVREKLLHLIHAEDSHLCVPLQGSGTFVVEAMISTLIGSNDKLLILVNGVYGRRMAEICRRTGKAFDCMEWSENQPVDPAALERRLSWDHSISHVAVVHCETTTGILNPIEDIAEIVDGHGRELLIDSMSAFGALPLDAREISFAAVAASSNKCLEGVPGMAFCLVSRAVLQDCAGNANSLVLDLYDQWKGFERNGQWRFTPPTHVILALDQALTALEKEGGREGRLARYRANFECLRAGMEAMGFRCYLPHALQAPIIITFLQPEDPAFVFSEFYDALRQQGYAIYPGKLSTADTFRIGCIGQLSQLEMEGALQAIRDWSSSRCVNVCQRNSEFY